MLFTIIVTVLATLYFAAGAFLAVLMFRENDCIKLYGSRSAGAVLLVLAWPIVIGLEA